MIKGGKFASQSLGIEKTRDLMERTIEGFNVRELWRQIKSPMPDPERGITDRFFQVVTTRLRRRASRAPVT